MLEEALTGGEVRRPTCGKVQVGFAFHRLPLGSPEPPLVGGDGHVGNENDLTVAYDDLYLRAGLVEPELPAYGRRDGDRAIFRLSFQESRIPGFMPQAVVAISARLGRQLVARVMASDDRVDGPSSGRSVQFRGHPTPDRFAAGTADQGNRPSTRAGGSAAD